MINLTKKTDAAPIKFTSGGYTHVKTSAGSYMFGATSIEGLTKIKDDLANRKARIERQLSALETAIDGTAASIPLALR